MVAAVAVVARRGSALDVVTSTSSAARSKGWVLVLLPICTLVTPAVPSAAEPVWWMTVPLSFTTTVLTLPATVTDSSKRPHAWRASVPVVAL